MMILRCCFVFVVYVALTTLLLLHSTVSIDDSVPSSFNRNTRVDATLSSSSSSSTFSRIRDESFWRSVAPDLHIYDKDLVSASGALMEVDDDEAVYLRKLVTKEGYVVLENFFRDPDMLQRLRNAMNRFHELNIPVQFCFVYDEFWLLFMQLHHVFEVLLGDGYLRLPDFWAWRIDTSATASGWQLHRDKDLPYNVLFDNGMPKSISAWIALSDANSLNSCMYVLPADRDPSYLTKHSLGAVNSSSNIWPELLPSIRALSVPAGSVLIWNQQVWHWGGRSSPRASQPRISVSIEFQSGEVPPFNVPLNNPFLFPKFTDRILLILKQTLQYKHMYPLDPELESIARRILPNNNWGSDHLIIDQEGE